MISKLKMDGRNMVHIFVQKERNISSILQKYDTVGKHIYVCIENKKKDEINTMKQK